MPSNSRAAPSADSGTSATQNPHAFSDADVLAAHGSTSAGLGDQQAQEKREFYGANTLPGARPTPAWRRLLRQFHNPLIYVLIAAAIVSLVLDHAVDAGVILAVVLVNAAVGFIQEGKAEQALLSILLMTKTRSQVLRNGIRTTIDSSELVPGDIVFLEAGDRVSADMRLLQAKELRCDESALTGESQAVDKQTGTLPPQTPLAERTNLVFMGTMVRTGTARAIVTHTGLRTQLGTITTLVQDINLEQTPLQNQLSRLAKQLTVAIIAIAAATSIFGIWVRGFSMDDMFQSAIGIAVAAIPEGLPAVVTIALAIGVQRMATRKALVRRLPAVEVLGSVDVICTDKTGTLTTNVMTTRQVVTATQTFSVVGEGYSPEGQIRDEQDRSVNLDERPSLRLTAHIAMLCNDASLQKSGEEWQLTGDPTEGALLGFALKTGMALEQQQLQLPRADVIPFASERCYMATLHNGATPRIFIKGAPDRLLKFCVSELTDEGTAPLRTDWWQQQLQQLAAQGMRVLAVAYRDTAEGFSTAGVEQDLILAGFIGIADPPREEAVEAIARCHEAGIQVKMITGDNPVTAAAIGRELGLNTAKVFTGQELDALSPQELQRVVNEVDIYARTSPANKLQLVEALQKTGHVVAMTGDGVNDAPALKRANIGVAMGGKGTDAAKEASHFILTDDNFATIAQAVKEGRTVYDNIVKTILYVLPTSLAEASVIIVAVLLGLTLPLTPVQILWVNMVTAVTLSLALVFEAAEPDIMQRPPRPISQTLITPALLRRLLVIVLCFATVIFWLFNYYLENGYSVEYARTIAVNALVLFEIFYLFNSRYLYHFAFTPERLRNSAATWIAIAAIVVVQLLFTYLPVSQDLFGLQSISAADWLLLIVVTAPIMVVVEIEKKLGRNLVRRKTRHEAISS